MKAISLVQPYTFVVCVSGHYEMPAHEDTDHRGKLLIAAGKGCEAPSLAGLVEEKAMCVVDLVEAAPLTAEQKESLDDQTISHVWVFENPRLVVPFDIPEQDGLFDVIHDIEYIGSEDQFKKEYENLIPKDASDDVLNAYGYITSSYFVEDSTPAGNPNHF